MLKSLDGYTVVTAAELRAFKRSWPCHGIPDEVGAIAFNFDARGDLVDIEYLEEEPAPGAAWDSRAPIYFGDAILSDMGAAVLALSQRAQEG